MAKYTVTREEYQLVNKDLRLAGESREPIVDISWNEAWTGTRQVRKARFDGNRVHLSANPALDVATGKMSVRTMTWEKLA